MYFILQVIGWIIFIYGFLSLSRDIINEITYKKISHNMKVIVLVKSLEENLENFSSELANLKRCNAYKQILVIDLNENDNFDIITQKFEQDEVNVKLLNREQGKKIVHNYFQNENVSFL
ncbi:MAG: hypothetical protein HFJ45_06295 [Clostridia bacterium]|nr:hypothetical protein [Clostridia bacterium]